MANSKVGLTRLCVSGLLLCISMSAATQSSASQTHPIAQQLFIQGDELIKQDQFTRGISLLENAASKGHAQAAFELASLYEVGLVVEEDTRLAIKYYEMAVSKGYRDAHFNLALLLSSPFTPNNDLSRAREVVEVIADQGDIEAQFLLANLMKKKLHDAPSKPGKAFYWLQHAANSGHGKAQYQLATEYMKGLHVSRSAKTAFKWFNRAAMQNVAEAHYNLALMHEKGDGVSKNMAKAVDWYESAAELGSVNAQQNLGLKYLAGEGVEPMPRQAIKYLSKAANSGSTESQLLLAKVYQSGYQDLIKVDLINAETWYLRAARKGVAEAQYELALMLRDRNDTEGAELWGRRATAGGHLAAAKLYQ